MGEESSKGLEFGPGSRGGGGGGGGWLVPGKKVSLNQGAEASGLD